MAGPLNLSTDRILTSSDGSLAFVLRLSASVLLVECKHCPATRRRTTYTMLFESAAEFDRWAASDPVRFDDPQLYNQLCRHGHDVLRANE